MLAANFSYLSRVSELELGSIFSTPQRVRRLEDAAIQHPDKLPRAYHNFDASGIRGEGMLRPNRLRFSANWFFPCRVKDSSTWCPCIQGQYFEPVA